MVAVYEIFYENSNGDIVYCQDLATETEAIEEVTLLGIEFPENNYYYEIVDKEFICECD